MIPEEIAKLAETVAEISEPRSSFVSAEMRPGMAPTGPEEWLLSPLGYWTDARPYSTASEILPVFSLDGSHPDRDAIITGRMMDRFKNSDMRMEYSQWGRRDSLSVCIGCGNGTNVWERFYEDTRVLVVALAFASAFGGGK